MSISANSEWIPILIFSSNLLHKIPLIYFQIGSYEIKGETKCKLPKILSLLFF